MAGKDSKPRKIVELSATARTAKVSIDRKQWEKAMEDQERSIAILGPIGLDILLAAIIGMSFPQRNEDVQKLMGGINMVQKARLAYILGLINKIVLEDLEQIHEIRNRFGHSFEASFAFTKVLKFVRKLSTAKAHEVTPENSYKFYHSAGTKCQNRIIAILQKQRLQKAQKG